MRKIIHRVICLTVFGLFATAAAGEDAPADSTAVPGFSWLEEGTVAAMACPGGDRNLSDDLAYLEACQIKVLISLTAEPVSPDSLAVYGISGRHLPVEDFTPPTLAQIESFVAEVEQARQDKYKLGIHCTAGKGRTGTMIAALFVSEGLTAEDAIAKIRRLRPSSVETPAQEHRIAEFAASRSAP